MASVDRRGTRVGRAPFIMGPMKTRSNRIASILLRVAPLAVIAVIVEGGSTALAYGPRYL